MLHSAFQHAHKDLPGISENTGHFFSVSNSNSLSVCRAMCMNLCYELRNDYCRVSPVGLDELNNAFSGAGWGSRYQGHDPGHAPILVNKNFTTEIEAG